MAANLIDAGISLYMHEINNDFFSNADLAKRRAPKAIDFGSVVTRFQAS